MYSLVSEAHSESRQTSKRGFFAEIVNGFQLLTFFAKSSVLDVFRFLNTPLHWVEIIEVVHCQLAL